MTNHTDLSPIAPLPATRAERIAHVERVTGLKAAPVDDAGFMYGVVSFPVRDRVAIYCRRIARRTTHELIELGYMVSYGNPLVGAVSDGTALWVADVSVYVGENPLDRDPER